ncbi:MAG: hypothetical protein A3G18_02955 [Rhodospirillales bacterium RIFCSPLOWO2_12_FULL_58_28]|nr:MAG: hypothetical protein A3H92_07215 [Rhodospirillales bacterium RIFCSPLOWO2_02_FULL_58_16]OHC78826.1 MAG: hypothetical protein A3G18_02955 [Rhodospirillales bacterium RIFCSPLOWO2_12_FULL_58_28]
MIPDIEPVIRIIRETAASEIMPRFCSLSANDITKKRSGDLVTSADINAEKRLESSLNSLISNSLIVGEEGADADPRRLDALKGEAPVWLIDPVDGTTNFVRGIPCFAVIIAFCIGGETLAAWIHDPIADVTIWAAKGEGAWIGKGDGAGKQPIAVTTALSIGQMLGSLNDRMCRKLATLREAGKRDIPTGTRYGCAGREYMDLGRGELNFSLYGGRLMPWDHAAGVLIHSQAGGYSALTGDGSPYRPTTFGMHSNTALLLAPDKESWQSLRQLING